MSKNPPRRRAPAARRAARHPSLLAAIGLLAGFAGAAGAVGAAGVSVPADAAGTSVSAARTATAAAASPTRAAPAASAAGATTSVNSATAKTGGQAGAPLASRAPNAAEADSFAAFHHALLPDAAPPSPRWRISRAKGQRRWQVVAELDSTPEPARAGLCRLQRSSFHYDERARKDQRWSAGDGGAASASSSAANSTSASTSTSTSASASTSTSTSPSASSLTYVWLARGAVCTTPQPGQPGQPALLLPALSDAAAVALLRGQAELLTRARLLFAGNTSCARLRALDFTLQALGPAPAGAAGGGAMYELRYRSDRDNEARVAVRQHRAELTAWNVSCPAP